MFPFAVALLVVGYGIAYWGAMNFKSGGKGPGFGEVFGLSGELIAEEEITRGVGKASPILSGQPPTTVENPPGGVWT